MGAELRGQRIVVIGASSGMGLAIAQIAAGAGAHVIAVSRSKPAVDFAAETYAADIGVEPEVEDLFRQVGEFDHLIVTAASLAYAPIGEFESDAARRVVNSKLLGPFFAAKHGCRRISRAGSMTFFSGVAAWKPMPGASMVAAVNGALAAFARSLAVELAPVRVNVISPGVVETPSWDGVPKQEREALFGHFRATLPARRIGRAEDLAEAAVFLMTNAYTTGTVLHVDGGHRLV